MEVFGVGKPVVKVAGAKIGEKLGRLKPNDELTGYSPLSRLLEFEGLRAGVQGKLGLWESLAIVAAHDERLDPDEIDALAARAEAQLEGPARAPPPGRRRGAGGVGAPAAQAAGSTRGSSSRSRASSSATSSLAASRSAASQAPIASLTRSVRASACA